MRRICHTRSYVPLCIRVHNHDNNNDNNNNNDIVNIIIMIFWIIIMMKIMKRKKQKNCKIDNIFRITIVINIFMYIYIYAFSHGVPMVFLWFFLWFPICTWSKVASSNAPFGAPKESSSSSSSCTVKQVAR
jgi:uncharacterized membrane protein